MYRFYNSNPNAARVQDCAIRAISKLLDKEWGEIYMDLCVEGLHRADLPSANHVWGAYMKKKGYKPHIIPDTCPECYTVDSFSKEHPKGRYLLALSGHVVPVIDGDWYDTYDTGDEIPLYYWEKEVNNGNV